MLELAVDCATREFETIREEKNIPGIAFGLMHEGKLVYSSGLGESVLGNSTPPVADSIFRIASMSKSFTAQAILLLRDRDLLKLDDLITTYLPWTSTIGLPEDSFPITIRDLLTMGAGFPTDDPWGDRQEYLPLPDFDALVAHGLTFNRKVNTGFEYSNLGYALLGRIISVVSGEQYETFMKREIHDPLGMNVSTYFTDQVPENHRAHGYAKFESGLVLEPTTGHGAFTPMGGLHSSVKELARWVAMFQEGKSEAQNPYRLVQSVMAKEQGEIAERIVTSSYGYGLFVDDDANLGRFVSHSGGYPGFGSHMRWHAESGWGIIALANLTYAPMGLTGMKIMNEIVHQFKKSNKPKIALATRTQEAIDVVNQLISEWNNELCNQWFTPNMHMDQPREDRISALAKLTQGLSRWVVVDDSMTAPTASFAKWKVQSGEVTIEVELLMSPEKSPRIQKLTFK